MAAPTISAASSILGYKRNEAFNFQPAATELPVIWTAIGLPPGMSVETHAANAVTGVAATDVLTSVGHELEDGDRVYCPELTGGDGLTAGTIYIVRDKTDDTFKVAAVVGGVAVDFTADVTAGTVRKVSSGLVSGACSVAGVYVVTLTAVNAADESGSREFVIGIDSAAVAAAGASEASSDWDLDVVSRVIEAQGGGTQALDGAETVDVLAVWKENDTVMLALRFTKSGVQVDPDPTTIKATLKEWDSDLELVTASDFEKIVEGDTAYFNLPVVLEEDALTAVLSDHERGKVTAFVALLEIEWTLSVTHKAAPLTLRYSTTGNRVQIVREMTQN